MTEVAELSEVRYAQTSDGLSIAYACLGSGPVDLLVIPDWTSQIELIWASSTLDYFRTRMASFCRLIVMDKRGIGFSDPVPVSDMASLELWMEDIRAVLDDLGIEAVSVFGQGQGSQMAVFFAATAPERTRSLGIVNGYAFLGRTEAYPFGLPPAVQARAVENIGETWGRDAGAVVATLAPSATGDPTLAEWFARVQRHSASPRVGRALTQISYEIDVRHLAPFVRSPTLVVHARDNHYVRAGHGRWLAEHIAGAEYTELDGIDHWFWVDRSLCDEVIDDIERFLTGSVTAGTSDRILATVLLTDVVGSTEAASALGDARWASLLDTLDAVVRQQMDRHAGRLVKHTGDGHLATFDGPGRAVRCALELRDAVRPLGLELRSGLHTGEIEVRGADVAGIAVHIASRVTAHAGPSEILTSGSLPPLVVGSGLEFADRGTHELKGVPGEWQLFEVVG